MHKASNILIFRRGRKIGDTVVSLPCFHRIAALFPDARRILLTTRPADVEVGPIEQVLNGTGLIHDVIAYEPYLRDARRLLALRKTLIAHNISTAIYLADPRSHFQLISDIAFLRFCRIKLICSPLRKEVMQYAIDPKTGYCERESERLARLLAPLGPLDLKDPSLWDLRLTRQEHSKASDFLSSLEGRPFMAISVGGNRQIQQWGDDNWSFILRELRTILPNVALVFVGSSEDVGRSEELGRNWSGGVVLNGCGMFTLRESAAVLARAYMFLGHDSGPMHLAASCGVRCVGPFGKNNPPGMWHPYGDGHEIVHNMEGIEKISPQEMIAALHRFIKSHPVGVCEPCV